MAKKRKKVKIRRNIPIEQIVLGVIATAGFMAVLAIAPGVGPALRLFGVGGKKQYSKKYVANTLGRMKQKGYITFKKEEGRRYVRLTKKGEERLKAYQKGDLVIEKPPEEWDGKWRVVIFDVPEKMRAVRNKVRLELEAVGFKMLQRSVWVYPYPCGEFIKLLKADKRIGKNIIYMVVDELEYPVDLERRFGLALK